MAAVAARAKDATPGHVARFGLAYPAESDIGQKATGFWTHSNSDFEGRGQGTIEEERKPSKGRQAESGSPVSIALPRTLSLCLSHALQDRTVT